PIAFDRADQDDAVFQVLAAIELWQFQQRCPHRRATRSVLDGTLGSVSVDQPTVPGAFRVKGQVRAEVALPEAVVAHQAGPLFTLQQRAQALAQTEPTALAAVRTAANHDVT